MSDIKENKENENVNEDTYESKAIITSIRATSRASVKVKTSNGDNYYTVEYSEERVIPDVDGIDIEEERTLLWNTVNDECDNQTEIIIKNSK